MDNRFLRCVAEHRISQKLNAKPDMDNRFCRLVAEERGCIPEEERRPWLVNEHVNRVYYSPKVPTTPVPTASSAPLALPTTPTSIRVYYSTKTETETTKTTESFLERYNRTMEERKKKQLPQSPQPQSPQPQSPQPQSPQPQAPLKPPRHRQLSIQSEESFPSLPSVGSPKSSPVMKGWSDALRKNMVDDGMLVKPKPRVVTYRESEEEGEEEIVFDADGFPHLVLKD